MSVTNAPTIAVPGPGMRQRPMLRQWSLEVVGAHDINPRMRRVTLTGGDLGEPDYKPGQDLVLQMPLTDGTFGRRHYTIRSLDKATRHLDIDFVLHGDSPAGNWARDAKPGTRIDAAGPRGRTVFDPAADWHLLLGDETCIPGILGILEILPSHAHAWAFIEIEDLTDRQPVNCKARAEIEWLERGGPGGPSEFMLDRLKSFKLPPGQGHAYIIGETSNVRAQRHELLARGMAKEQISAEGYWRPGRVGGHDHIEERPH